jgi:ribosome biogenesis GTPase
MKLNYINMKNLGLTEKLIQESKLYKDLFIGRVSAQYKNVYKVIMENGEIAAEISGKLHYGVKERSEYPAVGDFVMVDRTENAQGNGIIHHIPTRKSVFARRVTGGRFSRLKTQEPSPCLLGMNSVLNRTHAIKFCLNSFLTSIDPLVL